ncbi:MAG: hypothetical protein GKR91_04900 [Pseudomonadales bacterium]|nr:hypothetical protein [Pseudomonadales bacterium]
MIAKLAFCRAKLSILVFSLLAVTSCFAQQPDLSSVTITRLADKPIIGPDLHPSIGVNIQGPSMIRVPDWVENPLGKYYLYFADHKGLYIRLAYADEITGPWQIHEPGSLKIEHSFFAPTPPPISDEQLAELTAARSGVSGLGSPVSHDLALEFTLPHIASPDVHVDDESQTIIMYYHGLEGPAFQHSRVATSNDGIDFIAYEENLGRTYMRAFEHDNMTYVLAMPGQFYRSEDGFTNFEEGPRLFVPNMRHSAVIVRGNYLYVFWTRVGDAPESIMLSTIDISSDWMDWQESEAVVLLSPEFEWEGANAPNEPSVRSTAYGQVNQLRDPALYIEDGVVYLLYAVAGESGIALARVDF